VTGGDSIGLETTLRRPHIHDIVPGRNELVVEDDVRWLAENADPVWLVSTVGGSPRPLGEVEGAASLSADGRHVVYVRGRDLFLARGDGLGDFTDPLDVVATLRKAKDKWKGAVLVGDEESHEARGNTRSPLSESAAYARQARICSRVIPG